MDRSENSGSIPRIPGIRQPAWDAKGLMVLAFNLALLLMVATCGAKFVLMILTNDDDKILFVGVLTGAAYLYSLLFAVASVNGFEKQAKDSNITDIIRFMAVGYFFGVCVVYAIVIWKLSEKDYASTRYFQYVGLLALSFIAAHIYARVPRKQDVWILGVMILMMNLLHATNMIFQYVFPSEFEMITKFRPIAEGTQGTLYFFQDLMILLGMAGAAIYTLVGRWKV